MSSYERDFIERNGTWLLMMVTAVGACVSGLMVYVLKSRCTHIRCCGCQCDREVLPLEAKDLEEMQPMPAPVIPPPRSPPNNRT